MGHKITIEPVTRVEGHGKVTIHLDDAGKVTQSRFHIVEFRGFERFVQGRPYWEAPVLVERLCGICPVSHHLAAAKAMDVIAGVGPDGLTPDGGEDAPADALRPDVPVARPPFLPPGLARPPLRRGRRPGHPERHRRRPEAQGPRRAGRADAQVRPGDHRRHRREEDPRHGGHPRRDQQEPDPGGAEIVPRGARSDERGQDDRLGPGRRRVLQGLPRQEPRAHRRIRRLPLEPPEPRPQGRRPRLLPRRAAGRRRRRKANPRRRRLRGLPRPTSARKSGAGPT